MNAPRVRVDGRAQDQVSARDRGLLYGDGLFETVLFVQGRAPLWPRHLQRLASGAQRLQLALPDDGHLLDEALAVSAGLPRAAVRISITRGVGERGYAPPASTASTLVVIASPAPQLPADWHAQGITVRRCRLRLAAQPMLAGIKHLNRLEQVLARAEWQGDDPAEGLLCDASGHVIGATAANLFARIGDELVTPALEDCGIAGVTRAEVLAREVASVRRLDWEELLRAGEIFLTSSLRGILPVRGVDWREFAVGPLTRRLQQQWRELGLMETPHG